ncbi:MAG TPA: lipopolysaccharide heptosyltransferase II, partial [Cyanobacteria bacterium UBA11049]|nr:lipopolysaccharide heptosyltransferase II [Cyanobacteria bacterium UBA11049]
MTATKTWNDAQNILCIRLDSLGDVLMTTPAIRAIKESRSGRQITLLTSRAGVAIASLIPEIDNIIVYDAPWLKATAPRVNSRPEFEMVERLRGMEFDAAAIFTVFSQNPLPSAFLCYLADIPLRLAHCRENPYQMLSDWVLEPEPSGGIRHEVRRQLDLVASIGCKTEDERLSLQVPQQAHSRVVKLLETLGVDRGRPWVVIHPGATAASRRYPPESFASVARQLVVDANFQVLFTGTEPERQLIEDIQKAMGVPSYSLVAELNLGELAAIIAIAPLLISNNTGPVHIACAVGTPVVDLYALTNPQHTPWGVPHRVLYHDVPCKFCYKSICPEGHHNCLRQVTPHEVVSAALELYSEVKSGKRLE